MGSDRRDILDDSAILDAQSEIIDVIAGGTDLHETLTRVALIIERLVPPAICSILLLDQDGAHLRHGGSPNLPDSYIAAIDGLPIGPIVGSCGTAAYLRRRVIVEDIANDPLWAGYRDLAIASGLRACWSQPIIDQQGAVLGTFALYYAEPRAPLDADLDFVDRMSRLVRVALAQDRREKSLVESQQKLRDYLTLSSDWLWEKLNQGRQFSASNVSVGIDETLLRKDPRLETLMLDVEAQIRLSAGADIAGRRPIRNIRAFYTGRDGQMHFLNVNAMPIFDLDGRYCGYRGIAQDISRQVAAEVESQRLRIEAQDANRAKTEFLANISHELRTPLNAILGFSEIMQGELLGPLSERYRQYAEDIHVSGQHLHSLVTDILNLSRIEMGRIELEEEVVGLIHLIQGCISMLSMRAREQGVHLLAELSTDDLLVRCDRLRVMQALLNLVSNAVKFTPKFGTVTVRSKVTPDGIALSVTDTGIGMRPEDIPRALEPFRQIDPQYVRNHDGVGLGLALTKSLVELHGGRLEIISAPGQGTTAIIHLPLSRIVAGEGAA